MSSTPRTRRENHHRAYLSRAGCATDRKLKRFCRTCARQGSTGSSGPWWDTSLPPGKTGSSPCPGGPSYRKSSVAATIGDLRRYGKNAATVQENPCRRCRQDRRNSTTNDDSKARQECGGDVVRRSSWPSVSYAGAENSKRARGAVETSSAGPADFQSPPQALGTDSGVARNAGRSTHTAPDYHVAIMRAGCPGPQPRHEQSALLH